MWSSVIDLIDLSPSRKERRMSGLIRKTDALDILCKFCGITEDVEKCRKTSADGWCKEYCELKNMPTMDAIPVIRCRDCKKYKPCMTVTEYNFCSMTGALVDGQDFCSWAERKEE